MSVTIMMRGDDVLSVKCTCDGGMTSLTGEPAVVQGEGISVSI